MENKPLSQADHDLLITVNVKLDTVTNEMRIANDGTKERLSSLETRVDKIDGLVERTNPEQLLKDLQNLKQESHDSKVTAKIYRVVGGFAGGAVFFILTQLPNLLRAWGVIK